ncbi:MAG: phage/plasmid primase, P4 family [Bacillota bacterium]
MDHNTGRAQRPHQLTGPLTGQFLKLSPEKAPVEEGWPTYNIEEIAERPNIGVLIPQPYIAVDIDNMEHAEKLTRLVQVEGIKCQIMQTTRGRHFWFAVAEPLKNSVKTMTGIGLHADYRSWGKRAQVCVKFLGEWREWLTDWSWDELDELPRWLRPLRQDRWKFYEMGEGDGRNQALFDYQIELSKRAFTQGEAAEIIRLINQYILREPLPEKELRTVCREEAYPEPDLDETNYDAPWFGPKGAFLHNVMGNVLIGEMNIVSYHGLVYTYQDGCYRPGENDVLRAIVEKFPTSKRMHQNEVLNFVRIQQHIEEPELDEYIINVRNGRLDLKTGELLPHTPKAYDFQQINALYDPKAHSEPLDHMLMRVFCGDYQLYKLFEEMLGYCLIKNCRMQKIFIFFGDGNNGKSTMLRMICSFIGKGNYSTLSLQDLETTFRPAELENKLVNLGDDIPYTDIKDSSRLKSISSGERITVERKNKDPFVLQNYATLIYTTNKMPRVNDKSYGFYRRLVLIPLDAKFAANDPDFDPDIAQKVVTEQAMSYLLNMAVRGLRRLLKKGFTRSDKVEKAIETYRIQSSTTLTWVAENELTVDYLTSKHTGELYYEFKTWCENEGVENVPKQKTFTEELKKGFDLELSEQKREQGTGKKCRFFCAVPNVPNENGKKA